MRPVCVAEERAFASKISDPHSSWEDFFALVDQLDIPDDFLGERDQSLPRPFNYFDDLPPDWKGE